MPRFGQCVLALRCRFQHRGWGAVAASLSRNLYGLEHISRWKLDLVAFGGQKDSSAVVAREDKAGLESLRTHSSRDLPEAFLVDRICGATRFYMGLRDGQVGHISWVFSGADPTPDISLRPGEVEIRYVHTMPKHRRSGLARAVQATALFELKNEGIGAAYAHILRGNHPSEQLFGSLGFIRVAAVTHRRILGFRFRHIEERCKDSLVLSPAKL